MSPLKRDLVRPERTGPNTVDSLAIDRGKDGAAVEEGQTPVKCARTRALIAGARSAILSGERSEHRVVWVVGEKIPSIVHGEIHDAYSPIGRGLRRLPPWAIEAAEVTAGRARC